MSIQKYMLVLEFVKNVIEMIFFFLFSCKWKMGANSTFENISFSLEGNPNNFDPSPMHH